MRDASPAQQTRPCDITLDPLGCDRDGVDVSIADQHERRGAELAQPLHDGPIRLEFLDISPAGRNLEGQPLHLLDAASQGVRDVGCSAVAAVQPSADVGFDGGVEVAALERFALGLPEGSKLFGGTSNERATGRDQEE